MNKKLPTSIGISRAYLRLWPYWLVAFVGTLALFWVDGSKTGVVLFFACSLAFTIYIFEHRWGKVQFVPITILMLWLLSTIFLFEFGLYRYPVTNRNLLYFYLGCVHVALLMGYVQGIRVKVLDRMRRYEVKKIRKLFMIGAALFVLVNLPSLISMIPNILGVIHGNAFAIRNAAVEGHWKDYASMFLLWLNDGFLILTIYYWESTNSFIRCFFIVDFVINLLSQIAVAGRTGIFGALILILFSFIAGYFSGNLKKTVGKFLVVSFLLVVFFLFYSNFISISRTPTGTFTAQSIVPGTEVNKDNMLFQIVPKSLQPLVFTGAQYFSHGYYGLSLCLEKPFIGIALGAGQSMFLTRNVARLLNWDHIYYLSYPFRLQLEDGFSSSLWVTAYPWIASDVTFVGSILVLYVLGYLLALAWQDVLIEHSPFAVVAFLKLSTTVIFLPMSSVTQDGSGLVSFYVVLVVWWIMRGRRLPRKSEREVGLDT